MVDFSRVSNDDLRDLVRWWGPLHWPITPAQLLEMAAARDWTVLVERKNGGAVWDTGLMEFRPWASSSIVKGDVAGMDVSVVSAREPEADDVEGALRDVFVEQVEVLTSVLGEATEKSPGRVVSVTWTLENGSSVSLGGTASLYSIEITSPAFTETMEAARQLPPLP